MKTKYHFSFGETRRIYFANGETPSYNFEFSKKSKDWVKKKLNELDEKIFQDEKLTIDEAKTLLKQAQDINWEEAGKTGYVAALQAALKHINDTRNANCDPGVLDAVMLKGKGRGQTKQALEKFQKWYNKIYPQNITVDGEPGPESVGAILQVLGEEPGVSVTAPADEPEVAEQPVVPVMSEPEAVAPPVADGPDEEPVAVRPPQAEVSAEPNLSQIEEDSPPVEIMTQEQINKAIKDISCITSIHNTTKGFQISLSDEYRNPINFGSLSGTGKESITVIEKTSDSRFVIKTNENNNGYVFEIKGDGVYVDSIIASAKNTESPQPSQDVATESDKQTAITHLNHVQDSISKLDPERKKFYSDTMKSEFNKLTFLQSCNENNWQYKYEDKNGEEWYVAEGVWMADQYGPQGPTLSNRQVSIWKKGQEDLVHDAFSFSEFQARPQTTIKKYIAEAEKNYKDQEEKKSLVHNTDFKEAKEGKAKIGYISLFPLEYEKDPVLKNMEDDSKNLPELMRTKGYNFIDSEPVATSTPKETLTSKIQEQYDQGVRNFYLDLHAHGISAGHSHLEGMHFGHGNSDADVLNGKELADLVSSFSDAHFIINSVACHGGDFRRHFEQVRLQNAHLILQSKPYNTNEEGRSAGGEADSSYFNLFYHKALGMMGNKGPFNELPGKDKMNAGIQTIGDAVRYADLMVGKYMHSNAEVVHPGGTTSRGIG